MKRPGWLAYLVGYAQSWWADWRAHRGGRNLAPVTSLDLPVTYVGSHQVRDECAIHGYEPIPRDYFRVCGECWHVYLTAQDLVKEHNKILQEMSQVPEPPRLPAPELTQEEWERMLNEPRPPHGLPVSAAFPPGLSMRKVKLTKLDEDGQPVGEPVPMPDMLLNVQPGRSASFDVPVPPEVLRLLFTPPAPWEPIPYEPLTVDQVDLITCCPLCTHDW